MSIYCIIIAFRQKRERWLLVLLGNLEVLVKCALSRRRLDNDDIRRTARQDAVHADAELVKGQLVRHFGLRLNCGTSRWSLNCR